MAAGDGGEAGRDEMGCARPTTLLLILGLCVQCASVRDDAPEPRPTPSDNPRARAIVDRMIATYAALDTYVDTGVAITDRTLSRCVTFRTSFVRPDRFCFEKQDHDTWRAGMPVIVWKDGREIREWRSWDPTWPLRTKTRYLNKALGFDFDLWDSRRIPSLLMPGRVSHPSIASLTGLELVGSDRVDGFDCFLVRATEPPPDDYKRRILPEERWKKWSAVLGVRPLKPRTQRYLWIDKRSWLLRKISIRWGFDCSDTVTYYRPEGDVDVDEERLTFDPRYPAWAREWVP